MTGAVHDPELGDAVRIDEHPASNTGTRSSSLPCTMSSGRGASFPAQGDRSQLLELTGPLVEVSREVGSAIIPTSRACSSSRFGCEAQSSKSAGAPSVATPAPRSSAPRRSRGPRPCRSQTSHTPLTSSLARRWSTAARRSSSHPPEREAALRPAAATEREGHGQPAHLRRQAIGQLGRTEAATAAAIRRSGSRGRGPRWGPR